MIVSSVSWAEQLSAYSTLAATIVQALAFVVGLYVLCLTIKQLRGLNHTLKLTSLSGLLQLEADMCGRKTRLDDVLAEKVFERAESEASAEARKANAAWAENLKIRENTAKENWFNAVDRLCFVILNGHWHGQWHGIDWRAEYEDYLKQIVESHHDWFQPQCYPNIVAMYKLWQTQKK